MRFKNDHKGFSLVEMIIVIAIIGIMAGISIRVIGYISLANSEKAAKTFVGALGKLQAKAMSKAEKTYLYIYMLDDTYYICSSKEDCTEFNPSVMSKSNGTALGMGMTISCKDASGTKKIENSGEADTIPFLKISYKRDGSFDGFTGTYQTILIESRFPTEVKLVRETGRYIVQ